MKIKNSLMTSLVLVFQFSGISWAQSPGAAASDSFATRCAAKGGNFVDLACHCGGTNGAMFNADIQKCAQGQVSYAGDPIEIINDKKPDVLAEDPAELKKLEVRSFSNCKYDQTRNAQGGRIFSGTPTTAQWPTLVRLTQKGEVTPYCFGWVKCTNSDENPAVCAVGAGNKCDGPATCLSKTLNASESENVERVVTPCVGNPKTCNATVIPAVISPAAAPATNGK